MSISLLALLQDINETVNIVLKYYNHPTQNQKETYSGFYTQNWIKFKKYLLFKTLYFLLKLSDVSGEAVTSVIVVTWESEIGKIMLSGQPC
jgi:hypothetical protein